LLVGTEYFAWRCSTISGTALAAYGLGVALAYFAEVFICWQLAPDLPLIQPQELGFGLSIPSTAVTH